MRSIGRTTDAIVRPGACRSIAGWSRGSDVAGWDARDIDSIEGATGSSRVVSGGADLAAEVPLGEDDPGADLSGDHGSRNRLADLRRS